MATTYKHIVVAGQDVADKIAAMKAARVTPSKIHAGCFESESLVAFQCNVSSQGFVEAEIVESIYGYSLRYASGLQNHGLIVSARAGQTDGTLEGAITAAKRWQAADPTRRWVTILNTTSSPNAS